VPPHRGRFTLRAQHYLVVVMVVSMRFSARVAPKTRIADISFGVATRECHRLVHDLLTLFDVHDVVALVK
jgi:hypothetical protein